MQEEHYNKLVSQENAHWGAVSADPLNPQIWEDNRLFEIFFGGEYRHLIARVCAHGPRVLELGCGNGGLALTLAERGLNVTGIDLSVRRIFVANREAILRGLNERAVFQVADLNRIPLPSRSFECILAHDSLHHILELDDLLRRASEALVPGGRLIVMDFVGLGKIRKIFAAALYALLPTFQPYRAKWHLHRRLSSFLASEEKKRRSLNTGSSTLLNPDSPFEEISGKSILDLIQARFEVEECFTFLPFWYYLAPKIRVSKTSRYIVARAFRALDDAMVRVLPKSGAHVFIVARNRTRP